MEHTLACLRERRAEHLEWARALCRIPSISTRPENAADVRRAVEFTRQLCAEIGLSARIMETGGHPLVYAERLDAPRGPTFLVYGHVDVQPTGDRSLWDADPFDPVLRDGWLVCRGSADDKGQVLIYLRAVHAWLKTSGRLPVNLKFLIEGEEEIGSPNLASFIQQHRGLLACDQVLISDTGLYEDGWPTITVGTRGLVYREIRLSGPRNDLHSGTHGGAVANPAIVLSELIASLHDRAGRVAIPGFYADVEKLTPARRREIAALPFSERKYLRDVGSPKLAGERGYTTPERRSVRPTLEVNGLSSGYQGEGASTIIPARASAKVSMRLVARQKAAKIGRAFERTIRARCPDTVRLELVRHGKDVDAYVAPTESPFMAAARRALRESFGREAVLMFEGGSLPILPMFKRVLRADSLLLGFASPRCNAHGPNERVCLADLDRGTEAVARFLGHVAAPQRPRA